MNGYYTQYYINYYFSEQLRTPMPKAKVGKKKTDQDNAHKLSSNFNSSNSNNVLNNVNDFDYQPHIKHHIIDQYVDNFKDIYIEDNEDNEDNEEYEENDSVENYNQEVNNEHRNYNTTDEFRKQINIALLSPVSAGKSTLMNTLFVNQY